MSGAAAIAPLVRLGTVAAPRRRLICFPFAGGGVGAYRPWARLLPPDVELLAFQLPGRESRIRERPFETVEAMVESAAPAIAAVSDLPYVFFAHSMGSLVAYELTLMMERAAAQGTLRAPSHLFVSARRAPDEECDQPPLYDLPEEAFLDALQARYNAVPDEIRAERDMLDLLLPMLRADVHAVEHYRSPAGRQVRCPVHVFGGSDDRHPRPDQLGGWQRVAERPIRTRIFAGGHFYLAAQRDAIVADILATWQGASPDPAWDASSSHAERRSA